MSFWARTYQTIPSVTHFAKPVGATLPCETPPNTTCPAETMRSPSTLAKLVRMSAKITSQKKIGEFAGGDRQRHKERRSALRSRYAGPRQGVRERRVGTKAIAAINPRHRSMRAVSSPVTMRKRTQPPPTQSVYRKNSLYTGPYSFVLSSRVTGPNCAGEPDRESAGVVMGNGVSRSTLKSPSSPSRMSSTQETSRPSADRTWRLTAQRRMAKPMRVRTRKGRGNDALNSGSGSVLIASGGGLSMSMLSCRLIVAAWVKPILDVRRDRAQPGEPVGVREGGVRKSSKMQGRVRCHGLRASHIPGLDRRHSPPLFGPAAAIILL